MIWQFSSYGNRKARYKVIALWVYNKETQEWIEQKNMFNILSKAIAEGWNNDVLITSDNVSNDHESVIAVIDILMHVKKENNLIVGIAHPTKELFDSYIQKGVNEIWAINDSAEIIKTYTKYHLEMQILAGRDICPALHIKSGDPIELSVCGKRNNRLILVMCHFRQWCLANYETCPHWQGKTSS